jgi:queuosine precursor transporter
MFLKMISIISVSVAYIAAQILADISSLKIVMFAGLSMDAGTFIYPITFTLRDMIHKVAGIKAARVLIVLAAVVNIFMALFFAFVSYLPGDPQVGNQSSFSAVLSPIWRLVAASIVAELVSEMIDTEAYRIWTTKITTKYQWARVLVSNSFSIPIDSILFAWIAFSGSMPKAVIWGIVWSNILVKGITTLIGMPLIYTVKEKSEL